MTDSIAGRQTAVPFLDLGRLHRSIKGPLLEELEALVDSGEFIHGPAVSAFQQQFAEYCGVADCVGVSSGLDALRLGLIAAGIEQGDEVVVPAHTFVATVEAVTQAGGTPVLAEISEDDYGLDSHNAEAAITSRTRFLLPVHLYGQLADMRGLEGVARRRGVEIIEDACQAHGADRDGQRAGSVGLAAAFSFYPTKNLGAFGDAGALVTDSPKLAGEARALREHGQRTKYEHELEGYTARLDTIQALVLVRKLSLLDGWNAERRQIAAFYNDRLVNVGDLRLPSSPEGSAPVWHLYVIRTARPEALAAFLQDRGIASGRHYPQPVHLTTAYSHLGYRTGEFPVAEALARECLSLPIFPGMTEAQFEAVVDAVRAFFDG